MKGINRFLIVALVFVLAAVFTVTSPSITYAYDDYSYDDKGKIIGKSYWWDEDSEEYELESGEIVYYARKIKKGLTKKQVKYLYEWGRPSRTASASGGWSFWYYDDGSYIDFKKGKVEYWYDAAG